MFAVAILLFTFTASAWEITPTNQTDTDLQTYLRGLYGGADKTVVTHFYNDIEHLVFVQVIQSSTGIVKNWYFHSNKTKIGYSYISNYLFKFKSMCPDGHSTIVKRHIGLTVPLWQPNSYLASDVTGGDCGYVPPPNQTSIDTIKAMYSPDYTVTRLWADQDIFSVRCDNYYVPDCNYWDQINGISHLTNGVVYYSNTQKIGLRKFTHDSSFQWVMVRTAATVTDQSAKDDIALLTARGVESQAWNWVDYSWSSTYTYWFN